MAGHKILVIDDSKVIRMRVRDMLPEGDFQVLEAKDGAEGLNLIRQERPNLIMLDFLLPRVSGWEVYQELQNQHDLQSIPLVIMSGRKEEVTDKLTEPFEFFEFIEKPFEKHQLQEAIKGAISKSRLPRLRTEPSKPAHASVDNSELIELRQKVEAMETEIANLKRALTQLVNFVKQKL
ncbi:MAG: response regulator [Acaryochloris sp. RU_4_1]|nr:response regulator [Acaryochloris sp. RU_4_1]NJR54588.1 response regulator [Acaryochloris sp. CRU_2_0]